MKKNEVIIIGIGALIALAATALIITLRKSDYEERPPKGAPQLDIENPGSQHEFPKPPMESELG